MSCIILKPLAIGALILLSADICTLSAAEMKVSGAAAVAGGIITPNKAKIESETGLTLSVTANGDANGLKDLYAGKVEVAMVAAPMKVTEDIVNKAARARSAPPASRSLRWAPSPSSSSSMRPTRSRR